VARTLVPGPAADDDDAETEPALLVAVDEAMDEAMDEAVDEAVDEATLLDEEDEAPQVRLYKGVVLRVVPTMPKLGLGVVG